MRLPILLALFASLVAAEPEAGMKRGNLHPDFTLPRAEGGRGSLFDYRGKKLVLFHFASW